MSEKLLTLKDIAARLPGVAHKSLEEHVRKMGLGYKLGRAYFYTEADYATLLEDIKCQTSDCRKTKAAASTTSRGHSPSPARKLGVGSAKALAILAERTRRPT